MSFLVTAVVATTVVVTALAVTVAVAVKHNAFEIELALDSHFYIRIGSWDFWKQWGGTDIN